MFGMLFCLLLLLLLFGWDFACQASTSLLNIVHLLSMVYVHCCGLFVLEVGLIHVHTLSFVLHSLVGSLLTFFLSLFLLCHLCSTLHCSPILGFSSFHPSQVCRCFAYHSFSLSPFCIYLSYLLSLCTFSRLFLCCCPLCCPLSVMPVSRTRFSVCSALPSSDLHSITLAFHCFL